MSKAFKCDRCGKFYEENVLTQENRRIYTVSKKMFGNGQAAIIDFDICGECQTELEKFLMNKTLKNMFTADEVCKILQDYENDPDTLFLGEKGRFTIADIKHLLSKEGEEQ